MKSFEISSRNSKNGRRHFKVILHEIYSDSCVDEVNEVGTEYNDNGITWIKEYCQNALDTIKGMSLRCEFLDEERTELCGHGKTDVIDDMPVFENAVVIGVFDKGYITDIETENGIKTVCVGEGTIDGLCYHNFVEKLSKDLKNGNEPSGSVEILKTEENSSIVYKYGYKDRGRIPEIFEYSGYALLSIEPADKTAKILELNTMEENQAMGQEEIKAIVSQTISEMNSATEELEKMKAEYVKEIDAARNYAEDLKNEINGLNEHIKELADKVEALNEANAALAKEKEGLTVEINELKASLEEAQKREKIGELNEAIKDFSDKEKEYAKDEIEAFNASPLTGEINSIVQKIYAGIGIQSKSEEVRLSEINQVEETNTIEDIFSEVCEKEQKEEVDIF